MRTHDGIPRRRRSPEEVRELLDEYEQSGLTQQAFADRVGVSLSSISLWLRKARNGDKREDADLLPAASRLVPVTIRSTDPSPFELVTAGGATLRIPADFDPGALERLLALLEGRC
jgi:transposase-like protein